MPLQSTLAYFAALAKRNGHQASWSRQGGPSFAEAALGPTSAPDEEPQEGCDHDNPQYGVDHYSEHSSDRHYKNRYQDIDQHGCPP
jgi:hypothetical protein